LIGAGVSFDSKSSNGNFLPSIKVLRDELDAALPKVRDGSSLNRLYRSAKVDGRVDELITSRFLKCSPGETVKKLTEFRWRRIFTLNVDDALEAAYATHSKIEQIPDVINYCDPFKETRSSEEVPIIHLHGYSGRSSDGYVFDIKEYASSVAENNIWSHVLAGLIKSEPFFVLGASLEESDLAYFLSDRFKVPERLDRAPSLLVEPFPDHGTEVDCAEYQLALYKGTALEFFTDLDGRFPARPTVDEVVRGGLLDFDLTDVDPRLLAEFSSDFERVPTGPAAGDHSGTKFAFGHRASWGDLRQGLDLPRKAVSDIQDQIQIGAPQAFMVLSGPPGSGKTTALRRLAYNFSQDGEICFFHQAIGNLRTEALREIISRTPKRVFLFSDNFADTVTQFLQLRPEVQSGKVVIFGAERIYRIDHIKKISGNSFVKTYVMGNIGPALAQNLLKLYDGLGLSTVDSSNNLQSFPLGSEVIAVACCRILNDFEPLNKIIDKSLSDVSEREKICFIFASLASYCLRQGVEYNIISKKNPGYLVERMLGDEVALPLDCHEYDGAEFITPLNQTISDAILMRWTTSNPESLHDVFLSLADGVRPYVNLRSIINGEPSAKLAARLFDYDDVVHKFLGVDGAEKFYRETKAKWDWNSRYWHQIAQHRMSQASAELDRSKKVELAEMAVQHARHSRKIEPGHQFTFTMISRMLFQKMELIGSVAPQDLNEAISAGLDAIRIEREKDRVTVHPFMILFRGVSDALRLGAVLSPKQRSDIHAAIQASIYSFPRDLQLIQNGKALEDAM
jgi:GTPase SAR1 family protein